MSPSKKVIVPLTKGTQELLAELERFAIMPSDIVTAVLYSIVHYEDPNDPNIKAGKTTPAMDEGLDQLANDMYDYWQSEIDQLTPDADPHHAELLEAYTDIKETIYSTCAVTTYNIVQANVDAFRSIVPHLAVPEQEVDDIIIEEVEMYGDAAVIKFSIGD